MKRKLRSECVVIDISTLLNLHSEYNTFNISNLDFSSLECFVVMNKEITLTSNRYEDHRVHH